VNGLAIYCADVGSIAGGNFGWARVDAKSGEGRGGVEIDELVVELASDLSERPVALGLECPLFVPLPTDSGELGRARAGEGTRPWSAHAGAAALGAGLVQAPWILGKLRDRADPCAAYLSWSEFAAEERGLFLWEAFVSSTAKGTTHVEDAEIGARVFRDALPDPTAANALSDTGEVLSLIGAALLRTGWLVEPTALSTPCIVIRATAGG
jgi:hypothetical protein